MATNTITIVPFRSTQWNVWANWYDTQGEFVAAGASYNQGVMDAYWYGSVGMIMPYLESNSIINKATLNVRGELPYGSTLSSGTLSMTIFDFSTSEDGKVVRNPDKSISIQANTTVSFDIDPSIIKGYTYNFGVFYNFQPTQLVANAYLLLYTTLEITYETYETLPPDTLSPNGVNRNPKSPIDLSWLYRSQEMPGDYQAGSEIEYTSAKGFGGIVSVNGNENFWSFSPGYFLEGDTVEWRVRTISALLGFSSWSETATFNLAATPPLQPVLIYPLNIPLNGANGVTLEWLYASPYDTSPSRFDIRYRLDDAGWIEISNDGEQKAVTIPIHTQKKVTWQVRAYGEWGDMGAWSELGVFWSIGAPPTPIIVSVTNSNRPTVNFSAENLTSWELQIIDNATILYKTENQPFVNEFHHKINTFLPNGNYVAQVRITNEYGFTSEWGALSFTINTIAPEQLRLQIVRNLNFYIRLYFDNTAANTVYIYRSELRKNKYLRIGKTNKCVFDDFTARPSGPNGEIDIAYEYFVRVVSSDDSFADSNIETGLLRFLETSLAECDKPQNMLMLKYSLDIKPTKDISFNYEKTLTQFIGREKPVLQVGEHSDKNISLSFFCSIADYEQLEQMHMSNKVLILRDWRIGVIYGTINGSISARKESDGFQIAFVFTQTDFSKEVHLT